MGAFNAWAKDSYLEAPEQRQAVQIALNLSPEGRSRDYPRPTAPEPLAWRYRRRHSTSTSPYA